jgi:hypothetical protein
MTRQQGTRAGGDFTVHLQLERRHALNRRLNTAAVLLVVAALLGWLLTFPVPWQIAFVLAAGIAGFAWPVRGAGTWARNWIRSHAGLAYDTALQLADEPRDNFGLRVTVRSHARTAIARMEQPEYQGWWIAGFVLAALLTLLPVLQVTPWGSPATPAGPPPAAGTQPLALEPENEEILPEPETLPEAEPGQQRLESPPEVRQEPGTTPAGDVPGEGSDGSVLDRFLDNLRESPPQDGGRQAEEFGGSSDDPQATQNEPEPGEAGEDAAASEGEPGAGEESADSAQGRQESQGTAEDGEEGGETADPDQPDSEGQQSVPGESEEAAAEGEGTPDGAESFAEAQQPASDSPGENVEEGAGDGAGGDPGITQDEAAPGERLAGGNPETELLEGILSGDRSNPAGTVRLPPFTDVELPAGRQADATAFTRAAERAVTEGQVPRDYQEIIRNYFRP